jgi:hypothetical protein
VGVSMLEVRAAVQCSAVQCSAVQYRVVPSLRTSDELAPGDTTHHHRDRGLYVHVTCTAVSTYAQTTTGRYKKAHRSSSSSSSSIQVCER